MVRLGTPSARLALLSVGLLLLLLTPTPAQDPGEEDENVTILRGNGSGAMLPLMNVLTEQFVDDVGGVRFDLTETSTPDGAAALLAGETEFALLSRPMLRDEVQAIVERHHQPPIAWPIALDAYAVFRSPEGNRSVVSLGFAEIRAVFRGQVLNWLQLGGDDAPVKLYCLPRDSGTVTWFERYFLEGELPDNAEVCDTHAALMQAVAEDPTGIAFASYSRITGQGVHALRFEHRGQSYLPNVDAVERGRYPMTRTLFAYTLGRPAAGSLLREFLDFARSERAERVYTREHYYPIARPD